MYGTRRDWTSGALLGTYLYPHGQQPIRPLWRLLRRQRASERVFLCVPIPTTLESRCRFRLKDLTRAAPEMGYRNSRLAMFPPLRHMLLMTGDRRISGIAIDSLVFGYTYTAGTKGAKENR